ncbi:MAG: signal recognition particle-docking protein FtsY [Gammaproteobacteria bacterium]|nr:signal recognition particle-docking protein FtsY [Gammaproteobacteria bacterium]
MFGFKKTNTKSEKDPVNKPGLFSSLKSKLSKTRASFTSGISDIFLGKKEIDEELLEQLEDQLLMADVGIEATQKITANLTDALARNQLKDNDSVFSSLETAMQEILSVISEPLQIDTQKKPFVILMIGINGAGKTTTIGKLAQQFKEQGLSVMLAAGDTFRAAAVEQLQTWGERLDLPVVSQGNGADSASVIYDALQSARSRNIDILIADTAGRLHTQNNLMNELEKIKRVMAKLDPEAPHETMLVLDSGTGQNALAQAKSFHEKLNITGITLTKLDGTAKGGIVFSLAQQMQTPIRYIGVGETAQDLRVFNSEEFIRALLDRD